MTISLENLTKSNVEYFIDHLDELSDDEVRELKAYLTELKWQVAYILNHPKYGKRARNDDTFLIWAWAREFANVPYIPDYDLFIKIYEALRHADTIKRIRRKFNQKGKYLPDDYTVLKRRRREHVYRRVVPQI